MINVQGDNICLRSFTRKEYHQLWRSYVADFVMDPNPYLYNEEKVNIRFDSIIRNESLYPRLGIFLLNETVIGEISIKRIDYDKGKCEIGIFIANDNYKGLGYGTKAIKLAINYIFNTLKLKNIYADTMGSNLKMQSILNNFGFKFINKEEQFYNMNDRWEDKLNYVLTNNQYNLF